ncbi:MAG TPA: TetR/AcrR family transcriptional regulator [Gemmataceae bacterium]|nr:TetR/AcrR family transcriptional regulator [Gemmataceae bacterium]
MRKAQPDSLTRQKLLDAAQELMLARGYTATSVDEICATAGLTKGSFFHYFAGKEQLGKAVAQRFYTSWQEMSRAAPFRHKKNPLQRVFGTVDFFIETSRAPGWKGCLLGTFIQELSESHPRIREVCAARLGELADDFRQDLDEAKAKYAPRARWDTRSVSEHLMAVAQGAVILAKARQDRQAFAESLEHFKEYLKRLFEA